MTKAYLKGGHLVGFFSGQPSASVDYDCTAPWPEELPKNETKYWMNTSGEWVEKSVGPRKYFSVQRRVNEPLVLDLLPPHTRIEVIGSTVYEDVWLGEDTTLELEIDSPGKYQIRFRFLPYLFQEITLEVTN